MPDFTRADIEDTPTPTCPQGHPKTPDNIYIDGQGYPTCRICMLAAQKAWKARLSPERLAALSVKQREYRKAWRDRHPDYNKYQREYRKKKESTR